MLVPVPFQASYVVTHLVPAVERLVGAATSTVPIVLVEAGLLSLYAAWAGTTAPSRTAGVAISRATVR